MQQPTLARRNRIDLMEDAMNVAVLGASNKPDRYSFKAVQLLRQKGHTVYPVHPALAEVDGLAVFPTLRAVPVPLDTVTVYLSPRNQQTIADDLLDCGARRVIFNPGTENPDLADRLRRQGKEVIQACTLVLLTTGQFARALNNVEQTGVRTGARAGSLPQNPSTKGP